MHDSRAVQYLLLLCFSPFAICITFSTSRPAVYRNNRLYATTLETAIAAPAMRLDQSRSFRLLLQLAASRVELNNKLYWCVRCHWSVTKNIVGVQWMVKMTMRKLSTSSDAVVSRYNVCCYYNRFARQLQLEKSCCHWSTSNDIYSNIFHKDWRYSATMGACGSKWPKNWYYRIAVFQKQSRISKNPSIMNISIYFGISGAENCIQTGLPVVENGVPHW